MVVEQLVCARASSLLLNAFAPSSDAVRAQVHAHRASREMKGEAIEATGSNARAPTFFLRRTDPFDVSRLLTAVSYRPARVGGADPTAGVAFGERL